MEKESPGDLETKGAGAQLEMLKTLGIYLATCQASEHPLATII